MAKNKIVLFEKVEKRRIITFYFKASTVDVDECIQPSSTGQSSTAKW